MNRRNCWEVLHDRSEREADVARQGLGRATTRVAQLESQLERLKTLQRDYSNKLRETEGRAHGISQAVSYRGFLAQIGALMERTLIDLEQAKAVQSGARRELQRTELEQNKFEMLIEREDQRAGKEEEGAERRALEEQAISRFLMQRRLVKAG